MPAQAGIQKKLNFLGSRVHGNDEGGVFGALLMLGVLLRIFFSRRGLLRFKPAYHLSQLLMQR